MKRITHPKWVRIKCTIPGTIDVDHIVPGVNQIDMSRDVVLGPELRKV